MLILLFVNHDAKIYLYFDIHKKTNKKIYQNMNNLTKYLAFDSFVK